MATYKYGVVHVGACINQSMVCAVDKPTYIECAAVFDAHLVVRVYMDAIMNMPCYVLVLVYKDVSKCSLYTCIYACFAK